MIETILSWYKKKPEKIWNSVSGKAWDADHNTTRTVVYTHESRSLHMIEMQFPGYGTGWRALPDEPGWISVRPSTVKRNYAYYLLLGYKTRLGEVLRMVYRARGSSEYDGQSGMCVPYIILWPQYSSPEKSVLYRILYAVQDYDDQRPVGLCAGELELMTLRNMGRSFFHSVYSRSLERAFAHALQQTGWVFSGDDGVLSRTPGSVFQDWPGTRTQEPPGLNLMQYTRFLHCSRPMCVVCLDFSPLELRGAQDQLLISPRDIWRSYEEQYPNECILAEMTL